MSKKQRNEKLEYFKRHVSIPELQRELEWRRCAASCEHFLENYWNIKDKKSGRREKFVLWPYQKEALEDFAEHSQLLVLKARQIGFTTLMSAYLAWRALFRKDQNLFVVSITQRAAQTVVRGIREHGLKDLPKWMWNHPRTPAIHQATQSAIRFSNGSSIESLATRGDPGRGFTADVMWLDEWGFFERPEEAWASTSHTTEGATAQMIITSTANGAGTLFHQQWEAAEKGENGFEARFYPWSVVPGRDEEWYERKKALAADDTELHQEHPSQADEAFLRSGATVFDMDVVRSSPVVRGKRGRCVGAPSVGVEFKIEPAGPLEVFERPQSGGKYVIGVDVSMGISGGDYACAVVLNCFSGEQTAIWHGLVDPDDLAEVVHKLGAWYNYAFVGVEANGAGVVTLRALKEAGYSALYRRLTVDRAIRSTLSQLGWLTTKLTKSVMVGEANADMKTKTVTIRSVDLAREMAGFVYLGDSGNKMGGKPDDRVIAFCIANQMRRYWLVSPDEASAEIPEGSMPWFRESFRLQQETKRRLANMRTYLGNQRENRFLGEVLRR